MEIWVLWLIIIIVLSLIEICTVNLVTIWFIASALAALITSFFIKSFFIQFAIFVILGLILLVTTRQLLVKLIKPKKNATNLDRVIGMIGVVTEEIEPNKIGEVSVDGKKWSAISKEKVKNGENVKICAIEGVKLIVEKEGK